MPTKRKLASIALFVLIVCCAFSLAPRANEACRGSFKDSGNKFTLGDVMMGGSVSKNPRAMAAAKLCPGSFECPFTNDDHVVYNIYITNDGSWVNRATVTSDSGYLRDLIAGIAFGDSIVSVRQKLRDNLPSNFPKWTLKQREGEGATLTSDDDICSNNAVTWFYRLGFDGKARLTSVSTEIDFGM